jgi:hypothetical protein
VVAFVPANATISGAGGALATDATAEVVFVASLVAFVALAVFVAAKTAASGAAGAAAMSATGGCIVK